MMKKFYLLSILMLLPLMASADDSGSCGENVTWTYVEESQKLIISGSGPMTDFRYTSSVPWKSYKDVIQTVEISEGVTSIGNYAFYQCEALTSVTIPNGITTIGSSAFEYCDALTSVAIPNSVTSIGNNAFGASDLTSITIPSNVSSIGDGAFGRNPFTSIHVDEGNQFYMSEDNVLFTKDKSTILVYSKGKTDESYTIPSSVTTIGIEAFYNTKLTSVIIPNSVTTIGSRAFVLSNITSITIPSSVVSIGESAFSRNRLSSFNVEEGNLNYKASDGVLFDKDMSTLISYPLKKAESAYTIPDGVTTIADNAFTSCNNLSSVTFPNGLISIAGYSFNQCTNLISLDIPNSVTSIGIRAFIGCKALTSVTIGSGVTSIGTLCFNGCDQLKDIYCYAVNVPKVSGTITNKPSLEELTLHVPATSLETYKATEPWSKFGTILPIGDSPAVQAEPYAVLSDDNTVLTFYYDGNKESRGGMSVGPFSYDPNNDQRWGGHASDITTVIFDASFANCTSITSTKHWFRDFKNLITITGIENLKTSNVTTMMFMFDGCEKLTSLDVTHFDTKKVTDMRGMFDGCLSLESIDVSSFDTGNVTDMGYMFFDCRSVQELDLSNFNTENVTYMSGMFYNCFKVTKINISGFNTKNVTNMNALFQGCKSLLTIDVSHFDMQNVTDIGTMFMNCKCLTSIDVSHFNTDKVTNFWGMFEGCTNLSNIYCDNTWNAEVESAGMFKGCTSLTGYSDNNANDASFAKPIAAGGYFTAKGGGESPAEETEETIKITSAGQTTWCSAYDLDFTNVSGLKAYIAAGYNRTTGTIWLMRVFEVPAKEGILLMGDPGEYKVPHKSTTTYYMNMFKGTLEDITINETEGEYTNYYLSNGDSGVGFYKVNGSIGIKAHRAYLPLLKGTTQAGTRFIGIEFGDGTTNLTPALSKGEGEGEWYTLQGQRVTKPGKGLYIRNGKKVVIK